MTKPLLRALRGEPVSPTPIWLMRQAGRVLPEYRALKERHGFLGMATKGELAAEVTLQPIRRFGWDGAILFADILTPLLPLDFGITFAPGPVMERPLGRSPDQLDRLRPATPEELAHVVEALSRVREELPPDCTLLGFAGAPFTLAAYLMDGGGSREHARLRAAVHADDGFLAAALDRLADLTVAYLRLQVEAGAEAVQLFDTWAGLLDEATYRRVVLPSVRKVFQGLGPVVPRLYLVKEGAHLVAAMAETGADALSLDWRTPLGATRDRLGAMPVQGNLDPGVLLGEPSRIRAEVARILDENAGRPGHVFNLGHGLLPQTPLENLQVLADAVRNAS